MRVRAFGLLEVLIVATILAIIAAIVTPVYLRAKDKAKENVCISNLKQIHAATMMYRHDYDGDGKYDRAIRMGLPPLGWTTLFLHNYISEAAFICTGVSPWNNGIVKYQPGFYGEPPGVGLDYEKSDWTKWVPILRDDTILLGDLNHQPPGSNIQAVMQRHWAIGLYLGGYVKKLQKPGNPFYFEWWIQGR